MNESSLNMKIEYKFELDEINWSDAVALFKFAPLGVREPAKLRKSCEKSYLTCFAFDDSRLVGMGRAISDGEYQAAIYDVVVLPEYQGRGIGKDIMKQLSCLPFPERRSSTKNLDTTKCSLPWQKK